MNDAVVLNLACVTRLHVGFEAHCEKRASQNVLMLPLTRRRRCLKVISDNLCKSSGKDPPMHVRASGSTGRTSETVA